MQILVVSIAAGVVHEAVVRGMDGDNLALAGLPQLPPPTTLCRFRPLELGELVEYAVRELALRA